MLIFTSAGATITAGPQHRHTAGASLVASHAAGMAFPPRAAAAKSGSLDNPSLLNLNPSYPQPLDARSSYKTVGQTTLPPAHASRAPVVFAQAPEGGLV